MVLFGRLGPGSRMAPRRSFSKKARRSRGADASLIFYEDSSNYCQFQLEGDASGPNGNAYKMILFNSGTNRYTFRLWSPAGVLLATVNATSGMAGMPALIEANGSVARLIRMRITGTIGASTTFSSGMAIGNATSFTGGE